MSGTEHDKYLYKLKYINVILNCGSDVVFCQDLGQTAWDLLLTCFCSSIIVRHWVQIVIIQSFKTTGPSLLTDVGKCEMILLAKIMCVACRLVATVAVKKLM